MKTIGSVLALLFIVAFSAFGQAQAPTQLPGFSVQAFTGYTEVQGQQDSNGLFTELASPVYSWNAKYSGTILARADNYQFTTPSTNVLLGGPEVRFQFSNATFMDGQVFQPWVSFGAGAARASCVAASDCGVGVSTKSTFAYEYSAGLDMVQSSHITWRLFSYARVVLTSGPINIGNSNAFLTAIGIHF